MSIFRSFRSAHQVAKGGEVSSLPIPQKIAVIAAWLQQFENQNTKHMLYLIMYDIENNKVRTHIAKYLIQKGCMRIQKSVYLAKSSKTTYQEISKTLREINEIYHNHDSIFVLPVPEEKFSNIKVIGQNVEFDLVTKRKNVLFF